MVEFATKAGVINSFGNIRVSSIEGATAQLEQHLWMFRDGKNSEELRLATMDVRNGETKAALEDRLNSGKNFYINESGVVRNLLATN